MYGFNLINKFAIEGSDVTVEEYSHASGARLFHLDCDSPESSFGVVFRTVPEDSTGVFHILEHSVMSGSQKYAAPSPILYMLKNSLKTYANAITFQGKTAYLCSSCNAKDFENLTDVWLDAVFRPLLTRGTFLREGWHIEKNSDFGVGGVVFNEMSGALASAESAMYALVCADLFPDTYIRHNAGGRPEEIPSLTYEKMLETYAEVYTADNCVLFLGGRPDMPSALGKIDGYLSQARTGGRKRVYGIQPPVRTKRTHALSCLGGRGNVVFSYCLGDYGDVKTFYGANILADFLMGGNASFMKSRLTESGLMSDARFFFIAERQIALGIIAYGADEKDSDKIGGLIATCAKDMCGGALDKAGLRSAISEFAFGMTENRALLPDRCVQNFTGIADNVFYGLPAATYFNVNGVLKELNDGLEGNYFEELIKKIFIDNRHTAVSVFVPCERAAVSYSAGMDEAVKEENERAFLQSRQSVTSYDSMPRLSLGDVAAMPQGRRFSFDNGAMLTEADTGDIAYIRYYFSEEGFSDEEISASQLLCEAMLSVPSARHAAEEISAAARVNFGRLSFDVAAVQKQGGALNERRSAEPNGNEAKPNGNEAKPNGNAAERNDNAAEPKGNAAAYFRIKCALLRENCDGALSVLEEVLTDGLYSADTVLKIVGRELERLKAAFRSEPLALARISAEAAFSPAARIRGLLSGYGYYLFLLNALSEPERTAALLSRTAKKLFVSARMITGETGRVAMNRSPRLPEGDISRGGSSKFSNATDVAYSVPTDVNFNATAFGYADVMPYSGKHAVISRLLSLGYLWSGIRERGGAYGTGVSFSREGVLTFYSYRDPEVAKTFAVFGKTADFLSECEIGESELEGCIIGAAASFFKPLSAEDESIKNEYDCLCGLTLADRERTLRQILSFTQDDLKRYVGLFREAAQRGVKCTVGNVSKAEDSRLFSEIRTLG